MGSKKQKQQYEQNNVYEFKEVPKTPDIQAFQDFKPMANPAIPYAFANARRNLMSSFNNPLGEYTTPELRSNQMRASLFDLAQGEAQAMRESQFDADQMRLQQLGQVAGMTMPRMVQTRGYGYQEQAVPSIWGSLIQGAAQVGSAALM